MALPRSATVLSVSLVLAGAMGIVISSGQESPAVAHFHHIHINSTDPARSVAFYTAKFDCQKTTTGNGVHSENSEIQFNRVASPPPSEILSAIWHIGWGAEDMPATYKKQFDSGTTFQTPMTDISDLAGMEKGKFFFAYVDGPDHELIELNTANHHHFGHLHLLSSDPVAAADWYHEHLGLRIAGKQPQKRIYNGLQVAPSASLQADDVRIIIYPIEYARTQWPDTWASRKDFEPTKGRVIDHIAFTRAGAKGEFIEGPDHIRIELVGN